MRVRLMVIENFLRVQRLNKAFLRLGLIKVQCDPVQTDRQTDRQKSYPSPVASRYTGSITPLRRYNCDKYAREAAEEVPGQFASHGIPLRDKKVLDVGFGLGYSSEAMTEAGATVYGMEPDANAYSSAVEGGRISKENAIQGKMQDLPPELNGQFDVASLMLWSIDHAERDDVMSGLANSIKSDGTVVIGLHDEVYISDPYGVAVRPLAEKYFSNVMATAVDDSKTNRQLLICSSPRNRV